MLISLAAACLVSFKVLLFEVQDVGTKPRIRYAWCLASGWKKVSLIGAGSRLWSSCECTFIRIVVRLILVLAHTSTWAVVSGAMQYKHLVVG